MVFSSYIFIFGFLPATLITFWIVSLFSHRLAKIWLCVASLIFYSWWYIAWLPVLLVSVAFNYLAAHEIIRRAGVGRPTSTLLTVAVTGNVAALVYFKYLQWLFSLVGLAYHLPAGSSLPLGISFFTFTQIAFLIDSTQGVTTRYSPVNYLLFVTFFPHLIAGPIVHHRDLMPQFEKPENYRLQPRELAIGLAIFAIGLTKKALIADNVSGIADKLLPAPGAGPFAVWIGVLSYSMQLYFDFSGYSDMAIGLARLFGIRFPINFASPYKATSIIDFWQRWHITLTRFLTAYLYNPIALKLVRRRAAAGKSTSKRVSKTIPGFLELIALPTIITMMIAGIWHGAGLQFLVFGALHGIYLSINHAWRTFGPRTSERPRVGLALSYGALVYLAVLVAQIFFRASSVGEACGLLFGMAGLYTTWSPGYMASVGTPRVIPLDLVWLGASMIIAWFAPNTQQLIGRLDPRADTAPAPRWARVSVDFSVAWALAIGVLLFVGVMNISEGAPFIYFQF